VVDHIHERNWAQEELEVQLEEKLAARTVAEVEEEAQQLLQIRMIGI
jgi:hypothetical protein